MKKLDWKEKIEEITHYFSTREIMLMSPANRILAEQHNRKLFDLKECIREVLSSQLSDLKEEIGGMKKHYFANFRKYGSYPPTKNAEEVEDVIKNFENIGFDNAIDKILSLLDKKAGKK